MTTAANSILFLLRHMGSQSDRDLLDSLGLPVSELRAALAQLAAARRIERHGATRWRIVPAAAAPTRNPGT